MKLLSMLIVTIWLISCSVTDKDQKKDLQTAIRNFNTAFVAGDTLALADLITENYVHTNGSWKSFGKGTWLGYMKSRREKLDQNKLQINHYQMDELDIMFYENSAIVTARITSQGEEDGIPFKKNFRVTHVWVNDGGRWLRAGFHDTPIE